MITTLRVFIAFVLLHMGIASVVAQANHPAPERPTASVPPQDISKKIEAYLRHLYAFGPEVTLTISPLKETPIPGLQEVSVRFKLGGNSQDTKFYVSKDGRFLVQGQLSDMTKDPLAETRAVIQTKDAPSLGPANAPVTLVEFSDFECPVCRGLHAALRDLLPKYPQVRVIFKDFPIEQLHPWARTAAIAGRCAYTQKPEAFWKLYDLIYDNQDVISASNVWEKMNDYAGQLGLDSGEFKTCLASPQAGEAINASRDNGLKLEVNSTPTVFINGRKLVGADPRPIEQYIQYELVHRAGKNPPANQ